MKLCDRAECFSFAMPVRKRRGGRRVSCRLPGEISSEKEGGMMKLEEKRLVFFSHSGRTKKSKHATYHGFILPFTVFRHPAPQK